MPTKMVIDASVAAKWFLDDEEHVDLADAILQALLNDDLELHAPDVLYYEVCQLLNKACANPNRQTTRADALEAASNFFDLPIKCSALTKERGMLALGLAIDSSKGHADMTYLRLADELNCQLCTDDRRITIANPPSFPAARVILLESLGS